MSTMYSRRQAFDQGAKAARDHIVRLAAYPLAVAMINPIDPAEQEEFVAWTDGFDDTIRRHGKKL